MVAGYLGNDDLNERLELERINSWSIQRCINKHMSSWGAAIAQWIHLCLPSCRPGFQSDAHHLRFINLYLNCVMWKKTKVNKRGLDWFNCFLKKYETFSWRMPSCLIVLKISFTRWRPTTTYHFVE